MLDIEQNPSGIHLTLTLTYFRDMAFSNCPLKISLHRLTHVTLLISEFLGETEIVTKKSIGNEKEKYWTIGNGPTKMQTYTQAN